MAVDNVFIFVADALREDHLPTRIEEWGEQVHTVAASTNTPQSFSSIFSGLYPTQHQTFSFKHRLDPAFNLLTSVPDEYDVRFHEYLDSGIADVLGVEYSEAPSVGELEPPFLFVEREQNTHAPYNEFHEEGNVEEIEDYFNPVPDWDWIKDEYRAGCARAADRFFQRLDSLARQGLLEDTLVIFTSDHGELLGEYGELSHGSPVVPELVNVPTVINHPGEREISAEMMGHVDIAPTILDCLDIGVPWELVGDSVFDNTGGRRVTEFDQVSHLDGVSLQNWYDYQVRSVWDKDGGHVFNEVSTRGKLIHAIRQAKLFHPLRGRDVLKSIEALQNHLRPHRTFGSPGFSRTQAREDLDRIDRMDVELNRSADTLSEETEDRLKKLGYK